MPDNRYSHISVAEQGFGELEAPLLLLHIAALLLSTILILTISIPGPIQADTTALQAKPIEPGQFHFSLRVIPTVMDVEGVIQDLKKNNIKLDKLIIEVLVGGETVFPIKSDVFKQYDKFENSDLLSKWIKMAKKNGWKVYAGIDLLHWWRPWMDPALNPFSHAANLKELNQERGCNSDIDGEYASVWGQGTKQALQQVMTILRETYPGFDGLYIDCRYSADDFLGFGEDARVASIRSLHIDPADLDAFGASPDQDKDLRDWMEWRKDEMTHFVRAILSPFEASKRKKQVMLKAIPNYYDWPLRGQSYILQDWLQWLADETVTELAFESNWDRPDKKSYARGVLTLKDAKLKIPTLALISSDIRPPTPLKTVWENFTKALYRDDVTEVLLDPVQKEYLPDAFDILTNSK